MYSKSDQLKNNKPKKLRQRKCKSCKKYFIPDREYQIVCEDVECALEYGKVIRDKQIRQNKRDFKGSDKAALKGKAQTVVNRYIRLRDKDLPCISCGHIEGRQFHAGHYKPQGANQQLRYNTLNIHKQCSICNNHKSGNLVPYRYNLIKKIGLSRVEALESDKSTKKYSVEYLQKLIRVFNKKIKRIDRLKTV